MAQKRSTRVCREGYYYLIVLGFVITGAILRDVNLLLALAGMMGGPFLFNWRITVDALRGLSVRRRLPERIAAGDLFVVDLLLEKKPLRSSLLRLPSRALVIEDAIVTDQTGRHPDRSEARAIAWQVPCGQQRRVSYRGRFFRRGVYRFGPLRVSTRFPAGLVRSTLTDDRSQSVTVLPRTGQLGEAWHRLYQEAVGGSRRRNQQQASRQGEFHGLRDWQHGDMRRWIHWRTTARRGLPIVRQFERYHHQEFVLLVDLAPVGTSADEDDEAVETAVSFAATIVAEIARRGEGELHLGIGGARPKTIRGSASTQTSLRMLDALAVAEPGLEDGRMKLLTSGLEGAKAGIPVVLLTTRSLDLGDDAMFAELGKEPWGRHLLERIGVIDVRSDQLQEFFHAPTDIGSERSQDAWQDDRLSTKTESVRHP